MYFFLPIIVELRKKPFPTSIPPVIVQPCIFSNVQSNLGIKPLGRKLLKVAAGSLSLSAFLAADVTEFLERALICLKSLRQATMVNYCARRHFFPEHSVQPIENYDGFFMSSVSVDPNNVNRNN